MIIAMDNKYLVENYQGFCAQKKSEIGLFSPLISIKMISNNFKSLLIGILGTALVMVLMGQATHKKRFDVECITMSGKAGLIKCRRFQLDSHVWDAQDNHISTDWYNFDQANAL